MQNNSCSTEHFQRGKGIRNVVLPGIDNPCGSPALSFLHSGTSSITLFSDVAPEPGRERSFNQAQRKNLVTSRPGTETEVVLWTLGPYAGPAGQFPTRLPQSIAFFTLPIHTLAGNCPVKHAERCPHTHPWCIPLSAALGLDVGPDSDHKEQEPPGNVHQYPQRRRDLLWTPNRFQKGIIESR